MAAIGDEIVGLEAIGRAEVFARAFDGLLRSYLVDAVDAAHVRERERSPAVRFDAPEAFLAALAAAPATERPSLGLGGDLRLQGGGVAGCALVHGPAGPAAVVHLTAFARGGRVMEQMEFTVHGMGRASQRGHRRSDLDLVAEFGTPVKDGFVLHRRDVERALGDLKRLLRRLDRLVGTYVVVRDGTLVTVFRPTKAQRRRLRETAA